MPVTRRLSGAAAKPAASQPSGVSHAIQRKDTVPDHSLQQRAAQRQRVEPARHLLQIATLMKPSPLAHDVARHCSCIEQLLLQTRQQILKDPGAACQQAVRVAALRHTAPMLSHGWKMIAIHDSHALKIVRQHARGEQSAHAASDDDGPLAIRRFHCATSVDSLRRGTANRICLGRLAEGITNRAAHRDRGLFRDRARQ